MEKKINIIVMIYKIKSLFVIPAQAACLPARQGIQG
jgi:hypothetical protein